MKRRVEVPEEQAEDLRSAAAMAHFKHKPALTIALASSQAVWEKASCERTAFAGPRKLGIGFA